MNFYKELKAMFQVPSILNVAAKELADAELELLKAETGVEYAKALVDFNGRRVMRLKAFIARKEAGLI